MAVFETWFENDLQSIPEVETLYGVFFTQDSGSNKLGVYVTNNGQAVTLDGDIKGYIVRADNATVSVDGEKDGNRAWIILPQTAYEIEGDIDVVIKLENSTTGTKTTLCACRTNVHRTETDSIVDPTHVVPSISDLLNQIELMQEGTAAANAAAASLEDMTVSASSAVTSTPSATVTKTSGHYNIAFTLVKGDKGDDVIVSDTEPDTDDVLWVNPLEEPDMSAYVKSVNGNLPGANGNVALPLPFSILASTFGQSYDLNNVTEPGFYTYTYDANAHTPTPGGGCMIVMSSASGYATQLAFPFFGVELSPTRYYMRYKNPQNGWHDWIVISGIIDSLSSTNTSAALSANQGNVLNGRLSTLEGMFNSTTITNLNTVSQNGIYNYDGSANGSPTPYGGGLIHIQNPNNSAYRHQIAMTWSAGGNASFYIRAGGSSATDGWGAWKTVTLTSV